MVNIRTIGLRFLAKSAYAVSLAIVGGIILWASTELGLNRELGMLLVLAFFAVDVILILSHKIGPTLLLVSFAIIPFFLTYKVLNSDLLSRATSTLNPDMIIRNLLPRQLVISRYLLNLLY